MSIDTSYEKLKLFIKSSFPRLGYAEFELCSISKDKKCSLIGVNPKGMPFRQIKRNKTLGRSALYVRPREYIEMVRILSTFNITHYLLHSLQNCEHITVKYLCTFLNNFKKTTVSIYLEKTSFMT